MEPLVSIITPCYNGEKKVKKFIESVLEQTYNNIEFIIINDGSIDKTEDVVLSYKKNFEKRGYKFIYLKQENKGQDVALNKGLKYFNGKYLMWTDSDDILDKNNVEKKVKFLEKNLNCGLVFCNAKIVRENALDKIVKLWNKRLPKNKLDFFKDVMIGKDIVFAGGAWMARSENFLSVRPNRSIEIIGLGQNWQMLLPLVYNFQIGKIDEVLFTYIIYNNSDSNKKRSYEKRKEYICKQKIGLENILDNIKIDKKIRVDINKIANNFINNLLLDAAIKYNRRDEFNKIYRNRLRGEYQFTIKQYIKYILYKYRLYNIYTKIR